VKQPETEHTVSVAKRQAWLEGGGKKLVEEPISARRVA